MTPPRPGSPSARPIDTRTFDLLSLTMALVLGLHSPHLPWWLGIALALILGWRWWQRRRQAGRVPRWLKLPLLVLLTLAVIVQYGNIFGRAPGAALAVGLLVLKLLETETARDVRVGISFACFALMTALLFDQGLVATVVVALGLLPALATLRALEPGQLPGSLPRALLPGLALSAAALPLALLAFLLVPRLSSPLWGAPSQDQARTGLGDSMTPGNFTDLLTDDHPAMRVSFDGAPPPPDRRYFRAYVMWNFDGRSWRQLDIVVADDEEQAERRFFDRWTAKQRNPSNDQTAIDRGGPPPTRDVPGQPFSRPPPPSQSEIIGLFPEPGASR